MEIKVSFQSIHTMAKNMLRIANGSRMVSMKPLVMES